MSAESPIIINGANGGRHQAGADVAPKDMFLVPIGTHLQPRKGAEIAIPPIVDDPSAISAAATLLEIASRQAKREKFIAEGKAPGVAAETQAFRVFPPINGSPDREQTLGVALATRLREYGDKTDRWPKILEGRVVSIAPLPSQADIFKPHGPTAPEARGLGRSPTFSRLALARGS